MSKSSETLKSGAVNFKELATKLREEKELQSLGPKPQVQDETVPSEGLLGEALNLNAKIYTQSRIIPEIDALVNNHTDGKAISKDQLETTFKKIISNMVEDGLMKQEQMDAYVAPRQTKGTLGFNKQIKESQFHEDLNNSVPFNKDGKLDAPNLHSLKDKVLYGLGKICDSLGCSTLAKMCRKALSVENQETINTVEASAVSMTKKIAQQAQKLGKDIDPQKSTMPERVGTQTQKIIAKRQKRDSTISR